MSGLVSRSVLLEADLLDSGASVWLGHIPFAFWIIEQLQPRIFVEMGTHYGHSYFSFCQSVLANGLSTKCYAVDTWQGDEHAGFYGEEVFAQVDARNQRKYYAFSRLLRMRFDDALLYFSDGTIDLLHIDGLHTYEAVRHDFETWLPKLSTRGVVLFHDINVRERGFGVWQLWEELSTSYPHIEFEHSHGLGVLFVGNDQPAGILELLKEWSVPEGKHLIKLLFARLGHLVDLEYQAISHSQAIGERDGQIISKQQQADELVLNFNEAIVDKDAEINALKQAIELVNARLDRLSQDVTHWEQTSRQSSALSRSTSWRLIGPLRWLGDKLKLARRWILFSVRSVLFAPERFDAEWYLSQNPDVAASGMNPYRHYILFGKAEGRKPACERQLSMISLLYRIKAAGGWLQASIKAGQILRREGLHGLRLRLALGMDQRSLDYAHWIRNHDTLNDQARARMRQLAAEFNLKPIISVVMPCYNPKPEWLKEAIESVRRQIYPHWELCIADDASPDPAIRPILEDYSRRDKRIKVVFRETNGHISAASNTALALATGEYVALLDHDDVLAEQALFWVVQSINQQPEAGLIYSDEDKIDEAGQRADPYFKCDWNYDLFLSQNMICHLAVYRTELLHSIGGFRQGYEGSQDYDLALRCIERLDASQIVHIPRVLYHWRIHPASAAMSAQAKPYAYDAAARAVNEHLTRKGVSARVEQVPGCSFYRIKYNLPEQLPLVTLIIPTRNNALLLKRCITSILEKTDYANYEILVVDNGSDDQKALKLFDSIGKDPRVKILRDERPFNYSALNNRAVQGARGALVGLVNDDIEVISCEWLSEMVSIALQPGVGAVGARLWYPNNTLQHGGVVLGIGGVASHSHKNLHKGNPGYFGRALLQQSFSAVTAACLVVRRAVYLEMGGMEEENLKVAFGDVDFCLRVCEAGYRNVWTPYAEAYHHESATRGLEDTPEKQERFASEVRYMQQRWGSLLLNDPAYSPNLTFDREDFSYAWPTRVVPLKDLARGQ